MKPRTRTGWLIDCSGSSFFERISQEIGAVTFERSDSYYCVELISSDLQVAKIGARFVQLIREYKFLF